MISNEDILNTGIFEQVSHHGTHLAMYKLSGTEVHLLVMSKYLFWLPNGMSGADVTFEELLESSSEEIQTKLLFNIELFSGKT